MAGRVMRRILAALVMLLAGGLCVAQDAAPVRLLGDASRIEDRGRGIEVSLALSGPVPWRVFTLDGPRRLVVDLRGAAWEGGEAGALIGGGNALGVIFGPVAGGWSRFIIELARPLEVAEAGMAVGEDGASLRIVLEATSEEAFTAAAGAPAEEAPAVAVSPPTGPTTEDGRLVVAIDPGHGGVDPGAEREGLREAHLMLALALELAAAVEQAGMVPVLTREEDVFVSLQARISVARAAGADVLLSLHADALEEDAASGASIYTLARDAGDDASQRMAERHGGQDLLTGLDLAGEDEAVATALMDLARLDTLPRSGGLAEALAVELGRAGAAVNHRPLREGNLAVLAAADFPSVLLETGFLSDPEDRARLSTPDGRAPLISGIVAALRAWAAEEAPRAQ